MKCRGILNKMISSAVLITSRCELVKPEGKTRQVVRALVARDHPRVGKGRERLALLLTLVDFIRNKTALHRTEANLDWSHRSKSKARNCRF